MGSVSSGIEGQLRLRLVNEDNMSTYVDVVGINLRIANDFGIRRIHISATTTAGEFIDLTAYRIVAIVICNGEVPQDAVITYT